MIMGIILIICGAYWITYAFTINTKSCLSSMLFKVIPFFTGLANIVCAMDVFGLVNIF